MKLKYKLYTVICIWIFFSDIVQNVMFLKWEVKVLVAQSSPALWDPMDCSLPGFSVHGILQARILEWVAIPFSRGSSQPRDWIQVSCIVSRFFPPGKPLWTSYQILVFGITKEYHPIKICWWGREVLQSDTTSAAYWPGDLQHCKNPFSINWASIVGQPVLKVLRIMWQMRLVLSPRN